MIFVRQFKITIHKIMLRLTYFALSLLILSCGSDEFEHGTSDEPAANFIKSEPLNGSVIWFTGPAVEIRLFFDNSPSSVTIGGISARVEDNSATWEVPTMTFFELLRKNQGNPGGLLMISGDLLMIWKNLDGSERKTVLTFLWKYPGSGPPKLIASTIPDGAKDVDPQFLNSNGIIFVFDKDVTGSFVIMPQNGEQLDWLTEWNLEEEFGTSAIIRPRSGQELQWGVVYIIEGWVTDVAGDSIGIDITFVTKEE